MGDQSRLRFDGRRKTRGGGPPARYGQKRWRTAADISLGCIRGGGQGCCSLSDVNSDSDGGSNGGDDDDGRGVGGSSCDGRNRSGSKSRSPRSSGKKRSRVTADLGASTTRSRSGSRSGLGSRLLHRRLQGGRSGRSRGDSSGGRKDDNGDNDEDGDIWYNGEDGNDGGGWRRDSVNFNGNVKSYESGMRRGGKGSIQIPSALFNSPPSFFPL